MFLSHRTISFIKSALRLAATAILLPIIPLAAALLLVAEVIGIYEELTPDA